MAQVSSEDNLSLTIESQNLPTCIHANEISLYIDRVTTGAFIETNQLINIVRDYWPFKPLPINVF